MPNYSTSKKNSQSPEAVALARAFCELPVDLEKMPEPLGTILRETMIARGDKVAAFQASAQLHGLKDADALLKEAQAVDPNAIPDEERPLAVISADTILTTDYPDPVWAVPKLLPVGLTILAGAPKLGKSWLALQIALSVASGGMTFGERVTRGGVLYLALEDSPRRLQARMRKQGWGTGQAAEFLTLGQFADEIGDLTNGGSERLARQIERRGYRLVVIDTLSRSVRGDQNDAEAMTRGLTPIQEIAQTKNTALLMIDHHRKGSGENPDAIADVLGSTAKGAMADTILGLYRERGKAEAKLNVTGRDIEERTLALTMDWLTGCWQCSGDADALAITEKRQELLDTIRGIGRATLQEIVNATDRNKGTIFRELQELANNGLVTKDSTSKGTVYYIQEKTY